MSLSFDSVTVKTGPTENLFILEFHDCADQSFFAKELLNLLKLEKRKLYENFGRFYMPLAFGGLPPLSSIRKLTNQISIISGPEVEISKINLPGFQNPDDCSEVLFEKLLEGFERHGQ